MGGSGQSSSSRQQEGFNLGYSEYRPNFNPVDLYGPKQTNLNIGRYKGWMTAAEDYKARQSQSGGFMEMLMGMMAGGGSSGPSYEEQQADYNRRQEEQRRETGIAETQNSYSNYLNAVGSSTEYVNASIENERSNAALMGIDYNIDDTMKQERINNYFATVWGEGDQANLENLMKQWGDPEGFAGFTVTRGQGGVAKPTAPKEAPGKPSKGVSVRTVLDDDELETGNLLGV